MERRDSWRQIGVHRPRFHTQSARSMSDSPIRAFRVPLSDLRYRNVDDGLMQLETRVQTRAAVTARLYSTAAAMSPVMNANAARVPPQRGHGRPVTIANGQNPKSSRGGLKTILQRTIGHEFCRSTSVMVYRVNYQLGGINGTITETRRKCSTS